MFTVSEDTFQNALEKITELSKQNAALLEALENIVTIFDNGGTINEAAREATEAIRKAKEKR